MGCSQFLVPLGGNFVLFFVSCFVVRIVRGLVLPPPTFPPCPPPQVFFGHSRGCLWLGFVKNGNYVKK